MTPVKLLLVALGLGALGDLLLRSAPSGVGVSLWILALALAVGLLRSPGPRILPFLAAVFGMGFAWRDAPILQALFGAAAVVAWAAAFVDRPSRAGVTSLSLAYLAATLSAAVAPLIVPRARGIGGRGMPRRVRYGLAGVALAAPLLLAFGTLFAAADPLFARYTSDLARALDDALRHGATALVVAWLTGGLIAGLALARVPADLELDRPRASVGHAIGFALLLVALLFAAFLAVQARALMGGHDWIETQVGVSYAEYARQGFFQLLAAAGIALPVVLLADWAVAPGDGLRRTMVVLCAALVVMVLAVLASAARRMLLYVDAYGLTELRLYASAAMAWLAIGFVAFAAVAIRGWRERFAWLTLSAGGAIVLALGILNPAAAIVRHNAARAQSSGAEFDGGYATSLGPDAVPALLDVLASLPPAARCGVARDLLDRAAAPAEGDWRAFNVSRTLARSSLASSTTALEEIASGCP
jgi:hypothetical protein